ncbi:hypothetical protein COT97_00895 [Candidatus Falkowbacteria bacterium CG10_big_fil_rev_8_21_14_0_10_39_11]|uniref:Leucine-rich repeat domain-containing protein n=1 Tax=Candidatus Falkowbacteria bacterium CG10_big_fil_rev_8_21_14_0_10_39_11 TaxID=1974565 RepID=A0A2H0V5Z2_9BACT|nr:MAG: hypothetical protein COT97_00895 [Candidatus Falkowbacteria bacterium CG10_big_fil_rev_8_21_14_0_10_39_11]
MVGQTFDQLTENTEFMSFLTEFLNQAVDAANEQKNTEQTDQSWDLDKIRKWLLEIHLTEEDNIDDFIRRSISFDKDGNIVFIGGFPLDSLDLSSLPPNLFTVLGILDINNNPNLKSLPEALGRVSDLRCNNCGLEALPPGLVVERKLICDNNNLQTLPLGIKEVTHLSCKNNKLKELPPFTKVVKKLDCSGNELDALPNELDVWALDCRDNPLKNLLMDLFVSGTLIISETISDHVRQQIEQMVKNEQIADVQYV